MEQSIPKRFEQQAHRYPGRVAVKTREQQLTYHEFNQNANRIAWAILGQRGHKAGPVALLLEKGAPMIAAVLGVLKAGKIYVLLDPSYPYARTAFMLEDSQAIFIVTNHQNSALAGELAQHGYQVMNVDLLDPGADAANAGLPIAEE
jgi:non-ribosomal peptide synthetase component F